MTAALAASVHFKQNRNPTLIDNGLSISATGSLAGLGEGDVVVNLSATGTITATCTNPSGQNQPPGQTPQPVTLSGSVAIPDDEFKNGNVGFSVTTTPPDPVIAGAPDCPNTHWTERITDIKFTSITLTVQQAVSRCCRQLALRQRRRRTVLCRQAQSLARPRRRNSQRELIHVLDAKRTSEVSFT
jgi:hypothetical protein